MTAGFLITATGSWALPFLVAAGLASISFLVFFFLVIPDPIEFERPQHTRAAETSA